MRMIASILILLLMIATIVSIWTSPPITPKVGVITSLALSTYTIYQKHAGTEHARHLNR